MRTAIGWLVGATSAFIAFQCADHSLHVAVWVAYFGGIFQALIQFRG
jgi:hypothetical protein